MNLVKLLYSYSGLWTVKKKTRQSNVILSRMSSQSKSLSFLIRVWNLLLSPEGKPDCHFILVEKHYYHEEMPFILSSSSSFNHNHKREDHRWERDYCSHKIGLRSPASLFEVFFEKKMHTFLLKILQIIAFNASCNIKCTMLELQTWVKPWWVFYEL